MSTPPVYNVTIAGNTNETDLIVQSANASINEDNPPHIHTNNLDLEDLNKHYASNKSEIVDIRTGVEGHTLILTKNKVVLGFGNNKIGQLKNVGKGLGLMQLELDEKELPIISNISKSAVGISTGKNHSSILYSDNTLEVFGDNSFLQSNIPKDYLANVKQCECGNNFTMILTTSNKLYAFGENTKKQLGAPTMVDLNALIKSKFGADVVKVACGANHTIALLTNDRIIGWGHNHRGQIGTGETQDTYYISELKDFIDLGKEAIYSIAYNENSRIPIVDNGPDSYYDLFLNRVSNPQLTPLRVKHIEARGNNSLILGKNKCYKIFGCNYWGQADGRDPISYGDGYSQDPSFGLIPLTFGRSPDTMGENLTYVNNALYYQSIKNLDGSVENKLLYPSVKNFGSNYVQNIPFKEIKKVTLGINSSYIIRIDDSFLTCRGDHSNGKSMTDLQPALDFYQSYYGYSSDEVVKLSTAKPMQKNTLSNPLDAFAFHRTRFNDFNTNDWFKVTDTSLYNIVTSQFYGQKLIQFDIEIEYTDDPLINTRNTLGSQEFNFVMKEYDFNEKNEEIDQYVHNNKLPKFKFNRDSSNNLLRDPSTNKVLCTVNMSPDTWFRFPKPDSGNDDWQSRLLRYKRGDGIHINWEYDKIFERDFDCRASNNIYYKFHLVNNELFVEWNIVPLLNYQDHVQGTFISGVHGINARSKVYNVFAGGSCTIVESDEGLIYGGSCLSQSALQTIENKQVETVISIPVNGLSFLPGGQGSFDSLNINNVLLRTEHNLNATNFKINNEVKKNDNLNIDMVSSFASRQNFYRFLSYGWETVIPYEKERMGEEIYKVKLFTSSYSSNGLVLSRPDLNTDFIGGFVKVVEYFYGLDVSSNTEKVYKVLGYGIPFSQVYSYGSKEPTFLEIENFVKNNSMANNTFKTWNIDASITSTTKSILLPAACGYVYQNTIEGMKINLHGKPTQYEVPKPIDLKYNVFSSLVDLLSLNTNLSSLVASVITANLLNTLAGASNLTILAPTNTAFTNAAAEINAFTNSAQLVYLLKSHLIDKRVLSNALVNGTQAETLSGLKLDVVVDNGVKFKPSDNTNVVASVTVADELAYNGVIHTIDKVLMPGNIGDVAPPPAIAKFNANGPITIVYSWGETVQGNIEQNGAQINLGAKGIAYWFPDTNYYTNMTEMNRDRFISDNTGVGQYPGFDYNYTLTWTSDVTYDSIPV